MKIKDKFENLGLSTAVISFVVGTIMLAVYFFTMSEVVALQSYFIFLIIIIFNIIILAILIFKIVNKKSEYNKILKTIGLMLLNIPVAVLYFYIFGLLLNTVRITIKNKSNFTLENIVIKGCEEKIISNLGKNESKTAWINIPHDCSITVGYTINNQLKEKEILGYITNMGGTKTSVKIVD